MKKVLHILFHRVVLIVVFMLVQFLILAGMIFWFDEYFVYFYSFCIVLAAAMVVRIINGRINPAYKIAWIIPILLLPIFGVLLYLVFGVKRHNILERRKMHAVEGSMQALLPGERALGEIAADNTSAGNQSRYMALQTKWPPYGNTETEYLPMGEIKFQRMCQEMEKAEHYIFLEYFIIQEGKMWNTILEILTRKAASGVDVRVIYDDMGCLFTLPYNYNKTLESLGIQCCVFNRFVPVLSSRFNNRDHRKICVIDGHTGFTGGVNLADEYINAIEKYGHWKDTAILLRGEAVWSLTVMFLSMWGFHRGVEEDYRKFVPKQHHVEAFAHDGYAQPFTDSPLDDEAASENVYLNLISKAERYVYIYTPYLIIGNEMVVAMCNAAKCGVDVRIVTPHIPDKWYVHAVTKSYYEQLIESGVQIYEYSPGFIHAKTFVVDDVYGVVGTINLDFRSLYLHFECGVWLYKTQSVMAIKEDYLKTLDVCESITLEHCRSVPWLRSACGRILRVFAPLM